MSFDRDGWLRNTIRRASYKYPPRNTAKVNARVERGKYKCAICQDIFPHKEVQLDHVEPVINPATGFVDWNDFINRMFPELSGWQVLCTGCHEAKSIKENSGRKRKKHI